MREYELKKSHLPDLDKIMVECFGMINKIENKCVVSFGALKKLTAWLENNKLCVDTEMDRSVEEELAKKTIKLYNKFLELATGYTAKERAKLLQKKSR